MSALPPPTVVPILAVPFGIATVPEADSLNSTITDVFDARANADDGRGRQNPLCYHSPDDLLEWPDEAVRELSGHLLRGVCSVVNEINDFTEAQFRALDLQARGWFTLIKTDGRVPATTYPLTAWCAIYCVAAPQDLASRVDSGVLRLYESRPCSMFADASTAQMRLPYTPGHHGWRPVPGQMAVFPASLTHEIAPLRSGGELVLVTLRVRFVGPGQQGVGRW
jgi:hypothetical protein